LNALANSQKFLIRACLYYGRDDSNSIFVHVTPLIGQLNTIAATGLKIVINNQPIEITVKVKWLADFMCRVNISRNLPLNKVQKELTGNSGPQAALPDPYGIITVIFPNS
jgi:hypothetical protein